MFSDLFQQNADIYEAIANEFVELTNDLNEDSEATNNVDDDHVAMNDIPQQENQKLKQIFITVRKKSRLSQAADRRNHRHELQL